MARIFVCGIVTTLLTGAIVEEEEEEKPNVCETVALCGGWGAGEGWEGGSGVVDREKEIRDRRAELEGRNDEDKGLDDLVDSTPKKPAIRG